MRVAVITDIHGNLPTHRASAGGMRVTMERVPCDADAVAREVEAAGLPPEFAGKYVLAA